MAPNVAELNPPAPAPSSPSAFLSPRSDGSLLVVPPVAGPDARRRPKPA